MKKSVFDEWLKSKVQNTRVDFNKDEEWELLLPKLQKRKRRAVFFWWVLPLGLSIWAAYMFWPAQRIDPVVDVVSISGSTANPLNHSSEGFNQKRSATPQEKNPATHHSLPNSTSTGKSLYEPESEGITSTYEKPELGRKKINQNGMKYPGETQSFTKARVQDLLMLQQVVLPSDGSKPLDASVLLLLPSAEPKFLESEPRELQMYSILNTDLVRRDVDHTERSEDIKWVLSPSIAAGKLSRKWRGNEDLVEARRSTERGLDQLSGQFLAMAQWNKNFIFGAGIEYSRSTIRMQQYFRDTVLTTSSGIVIGEKIDYENHYSSDTGTVTLKQYRQVNRNLYNTRSVIYLPVLLGYQFLLRDRWTVGLDLGMHFPVFQKFQGSMIKTGIKDIELIPYAASYDFWNQCSVSAAAHVDYRISPDLQIYSALQFRSDFAFWNVHQTAVRELHRSMGMQLGLKYFLP